MRRREGCDIEKTNIHKNTKNHVHVCPCRRGAGRVPIHTKHPFIPMIQIGTMERRRWRKQNDKKRKNEGARVSMSQWTGKRWGLVRSAITTSSRDVLPARSPSELRVTCNKRGEVTIYKYVYIYSIYISSPPPRGTCCQRARPES